MVAIFFFLLHIYNDISRHKLFRDFEKTSKNFFEKSLCPQYKNKITNQKCSCSEKIFLSLHLYNDISQKKYSTISKIFFIFSKGYGSSIYKKQKSGGNLFSDCRHLNIPLSPGITLAFSLTVWKRCCCLQSRVSSIPRFACIPLFLNRKSFCPFHQEHLQIPRPSY